MKWQTKFWVITGVVLSIFATTMAFGSESFLDNSGCNMTEDDTLLQPFTSNGVFSNGVMHSSAQGYGGHYADCYAPKIYAQNQQIIKLLSMSICDKWEKDYSPVGEAQLNKLGLNECTNELVNMTK